MQWAAPLDDDDDAGGEDEPRATVREFVIADFAGHARTRRALDLAFVGSNRLLALVRRDSALELRVEGVDDTVAVRRAALP